LISFTLPKKGRGKEVNQGSKISTIFGVFSLLFHFMLVDVKGFLGSPMLGKFIPSRCVSFVSVLQIVTWFLFAQETENKQWESDGT
jgi:hypothetical protein